MLMRNFLPWIVLAGILGFVLGGTYFFGSQEPPQGTFTNDCKPISEEQDKARKEHRAPAETASPIHPEQPQPHQTTSPKGGNEVGARGERPDYECQLAIYTEQLARFTRWLVIATGLLAVIGLVQGFYIRQAVINDEESRRTLQRTSVSGGGTVIDYGTRFQINMNNHGGTAARLRWIWYGFISDLNVGNTPVPPYSTRLSWLDSIGPGESHHRVATIPIPPPLGAEQVLFVRFVYDDIYFGECTAGFVVRIIPHNPDPEPIAAPDAYTSRTERGAWIAPELPRTRPTES
jgi:hypothetical protein